jgi:nicotinate-nucleotide pyrophosphorylase (carboxylating)
VVCGSPLAASLFARFDANAEMTAMVEEGSRVSADTTILEVRADVRAILTAERCALNFLMRLCGIATAARAATDAVPNGCRTRIFDTRKTTPGWRRLDKAAVRTGGAENHRQGLFDVVLIKDNHLAAAPSITEAVHRAREHVGDTMVVEVEIDRLDQLSEAIASGADIVLLDNFSNDELRRAVAETAGRVELEVSGGVTLARIPDLARTGVDRISVGALTHTVIPADLSLDLA